MPVPCKRMRVTDMTSTMGTVTWVCLIDDQTLAQLDHIANLAARHSGDLVDHAEPESWVASAAWDALEIANKLHQLVLETPIEFWPLYVGGVKVGAHGHNA